MINEKRTELIKESYDKAVEVNGEALAKLTDGDQSASGAFIRAREIIQKTLKERGLKGSDVFSEMMAERDAERLERARKLRAIAEHEETDFIAGQEYLNAMIEGYSDMSPTIDEEIEDRLQSYVGGLKEEIRKLNEEKDKLRAELAYEEYCATEERMYGYELIDIIARCQPFIGKDISELSRKITDVLKASEV